MIAQLLAKLNLTLKEFRLLLVLMVIPLLSVLIGIGWLVRGDIGLFLVGGFSAIIWAVVLIGFFNFYRERFYKSKAERGRPVVFSQFGGRAQTHVVVYDRLLAITGQEKILLYPQDIKNLKPYASLLQRVLVVVPFKLQTQYPIMIYTGDPVHLKKIIEQALRLKEMPDYGQEPELESLSEVERKERAKYPWLQ